MKYDFDQPLNRRETDSIKWNLYPSEVIPLWVADMDFCSADSVVQALKSRINHGVFGYSRPSQELIQVIQNRMQMLYRWNVDAPEIVFIPGIVAGINIAIQAFADAGEGILAQPPVYFHFLRDPVQHGRILRDPPLVKNGDAYEIDFDRFEHAIANDTRVFILCNPHNPVGRVFTKEELESLAETCLRHGLIICSDEIHCDLVFPPHSHIPIASLSPEIEDRTVTLMAPSKTYNMAGLDCGYAIIKNPDLRRRWKDFSYGLVPGINIMGHVAALAALKGGQEWLEQVMDYLQGNRDYLAAYINEMMPSIQMCRMEATYLAWMDCGQTGMKMKPAEFFLKKAHVALSDGEDFGKGGKNFIRLNFACSRKILAQALDRMKDALETI
jgi:cystathionine beta-lyase